jgi:hypothetical protein
VADRGVIRAQLFTHLAQTSPQGIRIRISQPLLRFTQSLDRVNVNPRPGQLKSI